MVCTVWCETWLPSEQLPSTSSSSLCTSEPNMVSYLSKWPRGLESSQGRERWCSKIPATRERCTWPADLGKSPAELHLLCFNHMYGFRSTNKRRKWYICCEDYICLWPRPWGWGLCGLFWCAVPVIWRTIESWVTRLCNSTVIIICSVSWANAFHSGLLQLLQLVESTSAESWELPTITWLPWEL